MNKDLKNKTVDYLRLQRGRELRKKYKDSTCTKLRNSKIRFCLSEMLSSPSLQTFNRTSEPVTSIYIALLDLNTITTKLSTGDDDLVKQKVTLLLQR